MSTELNYLAKIENNLHKLHSLAERYVKALEEQNRLTKDQLTDADKEWCCHCNKSVVPDVWTGGGGPERRCPEPECRALLGWGWRKEG